MPKLTGPLFSIEAAGTVGKTLVYYRQNSQNLVREYAVPSNPSTPAQVAQRARFANAKSAEAATIPAVINSWEDNWRLLPGEVPANPFVAAQIQAQIYNSLTPALAITSLQAEYVGGPVYLRVRISYEQFNNPGGPPPGGGVPVIIQALDPTGSEDNYVYTPNLDIVPPTPSGTVDYAFDGFPLGLDSFRLMFYLCIEQLFICCICYNLEVEII